MGKAFPASVVFLVLAATGLSAAGFTTSGRDVEPVLLRGSSLTTLLGTPLDEIGLFRWDDTATEFLPIPYQIDERFAHVFNPGDEFEFTQTIYDVFGEDDGLFDVDDEIAFLFGDAGSSAPVDAPWVEGADDVRIAVEVVDARHGWPTVSRWVYAFVGPALPRSPTSYVEWPGGPESDVASDTWIVEYDDRWLLTGLRIRPPCGDDSDLIDRFKGRALSHGIEEDEEMWNTGSIFLGGRVGPVRAIRYVRGAASGVNTIQLDAIYRGAWSRTLDLRVHPIAWARLYFDLLPRGGSHFYSATAPQGVAIDGQPDAVPETFAEWSLVSTPGGGFATVWEVPPSALYDSRVSFFVDDQEYDDQVLVNPEYGDDDDAAFGSHGSELRTIGNAHVDGITFRILVYHLCGNVGDASVGETFFEFRDHPFDISCFEEWRELGPIRALEITREGEDLRLGWPAIAGADGYRVYTALAADLPASSWSRLGETQDLSYRDAGGASAPADTCYSVVAYGPQGEGEW